MDGLCDLPLDVMRGVNGGSDEGSWLVSVGVPISVKDATFPAVILDEIDDLSEAFPG